MAELKLHFRKIRGENTERWVLQSISYREHASAGVTLENIRDFKWGENSGLMALTVFFLKCASHALEAPDGRPPQRAILSTRDNLIAASVSTAIDQSKSKSKKQRVWIRQLFGDRGLDFIQRKTPEEQGRRFIDLSLNLSANRLRYMDIAVHLTAHAVTDTRQLGMVLDNVIEQWGYAHDQSQIRVKRNKAGGGPTGPRSGGCHLLIRYGPDQQTWVADCLGPCLKAGGADVLLGPIDDPVGVAPSPEVLGSAPGPARVEVFVFSADTTDLNASPGQSREKPDDSPMLAVLRSGGRQPPTEGPLSWHCIDLRDDRDAQAWADLFAACGTDPRVPAVQWLDARDNIRQYLRCGDSVNLVMNLVKLSVKQWVPLIYTLKDEETRPLGVVDLYSPDVATRPGLIGEILAQVCGTCQQVPPVPADLVFLSDVLGALPRPPWLAILHADMLRHHDYKDDLPLFAALHSLTSETPKRRRRLVLLVHSRDPIADLFPPGHTFSSLEFKTVWLGEIQGNRSRSVDDQTAPLGVARRGPAS